MAAVCAACPVCFECADFADCEAMTSGFWSGRFRDLRVAVDGVAVDGAA